MAKKVIEIPEDKIRVAIWMTKKNKTKKAICEYLGIAYNTKRLDKIIEDFKEKQVRVEELKKKARAKTLSEYEKKEIAKSYQDGESISAIADRLYLTSPRIKKVLIELGVPIRGRSKKTPAKTEHVKQDLEIKFGKGDKVFVGNLNCFAYVKEVFDEDYLDYLSDGYSKAVYMDVNLKPDEEPKRGIHYEVYWFLYEGNYMWGKLEALQNHIKNIEEAIIETGRELYRIWLDTDKGGFYTYTRDKLFPVVS